MLAWAAVSAAAGSIFACLLSHVLFKDSSTSLGRLLPKALRSSRGHARGPRTIAREDCQAGLAVHPLVLVLVKRLLHGLVRGAGTLSALAESSQELVERLAELAELILEHEVARETSVGDPKRAPEPPRTTTTYTTSIHTGAVIVRHSLASVLDV